MCFDFSRSLQVSLFYINFKYHFCVSYLDVFELEKHAHKISKSIFKYFRCLKCVLPFILEYPEHCCVSSKTI